MATGDKLSVQRDRYIPCAATHICCDLDWKAQIEGDVLLLLSRSVATWGEHDVFNHPFFYPAGWTAW